MTTKFLNFLCMSWFLSVLICLVVEGSYFSTTETTVFNDLINPLTTMKLGGIVSIPAPNLYFFRGLYHVLIWDYSFYEGSYIIIRYFWAVTLTPGVAWGVAQVMAPVFANLLRLFSITG